MEKSKALLSIGIPTYNRKKRLEKSIKTILNYSNDILILIIDNASTDGTFAMMSQFKDNSNIIYIRNDKNIGYEKNINKVIFESKQYSDYTLYLGDDDLLEEKFFKDIPLILRKHNPNLILLNSRAFIGGQIRINLEKDYIEHSIFNFMRLMLHITYGNVIVDNRLILEKDAQKYIGTSHTYLGAICEMLNKVQIAQGGINVYITKFPYVCWGIKEDSEIYYSPDVLSGYGRFHARLPKNLQDDVFFHLKAYLLSVNPQGASLTWKGYIEERKKDISFSSDIRLLSLEEMLNKYDVFKKYVNKKIIIFGAGKEGEKIFKLVNNKCNIYCFIDNDQTKWGDIFCNKEIKSPNILDKDIDKEFLIVIAIHPVLGGEKVFTQLIELNMKYKQDFVMMEDFYYDLALEIVTEEHNKRC